MNTMTDDDEIEKRRKHWETVLDGKDPIDWIADYEKFKKDTNTVFTDQQNRIASLEMQIIKLLQSNSQPWTIQQVPGNPMSGVSSGSWSPPISQYGTLQGVN
jgi:hypothetical protein